MKNTFSNEAGSELLTEDDEKLTKFNSFYRWTICAKWSCSCYVTAQLTNVCVLVCHKAVELVKFSFQYMFANISKLHFKRLILFILCPSPKFSTYVYFYQGVEKLSVSCFQQSVVLREQCNFSKVFFLDLESFIFHRKLVHLH